MDGPILRRKRKKARPARIPIRCMFCGSDRFSTYSKWVSARSHGHFMRCSVCNVQTMFGPDTPSLDIALSLSEMMADPEVGPALRQLIVDKTAERTARARYVTAQAPEGLPEEP